VGKVFLIYKKLFNCLRGSKISKIPGIRSTIFFINKKLKPEYIEFFGNKVYLSKNDYSLNLLDDENSEIDLFKKNIKLEDKVIDVGANIGWYTLIFGKIVGNKGKVYSFEPGHDNYTILKKNIVINKFNNIISENVAVSNINGNLKLELSEVGNHKVGKDGITIKCIKLDDYFNNEKIDFVKIDAEGHEFNILSGMQKILSNNDKIKLKIEFYYKLIKESGNEPSNLLDLLIKNKFSLFDLRDKNKKVTKDEFLKKYSQNIGATDIFCIRE
jgi:FkbM family methyltransferase